MRFFLSFLFLPTTLHVAHRISATMTPRSTFVDQVRCHIFLSNSYPLEKEYYLIGRRRENEAGSCISREQVGRWDAKYALMHWLIETRNTPPKLRLSSCENYSFPPLTSTALLCSMFLVADTRL